MKNVEKISETITHWIGTPLSIIVHTILFVGIFSLSLLGYTTDEILLTLTTLVSLEAIYLSIFIQMTVNKTTASLSSVEKDIDDIQDDVEGIESDVKEISEDHFEDEAEEDQVIKAIKDIENRLVKLHHDVVELNKKNGNHSTPAPKTL